MNPPKPQEQSSWSRRYTDLVQEDALQVLTVQCSAFPTFIRSIAHLESYSYAPGKWTIKQMLGHIIDTERIFSYRALCFARNEQQALPGFDENQYVNESDFSGRSLNSLLNEFEFLRKSNILLFKSLSEEKLDRVGISSGEPISVRTLVYLCAGHLIHHIGVIKERYL